MSNKERIGKSLDLLRQGLYPYVKQKMQADYGDEWVDNAGSYLRDYQKVKQELETILQEDTSALLTVIARDKVFKRKTGLSRPDLARVSELREIRNQWAHQATFSIEDTYRAIDTVLRLLKSIESAQVKAVEKQRQQVLRLLAQEQSGYDIDPVAVSPV
ncbi:MAG: hypothetical protein F6K30_08935, partial [Cyanothece sp. SIO2G6]|nr:hypothetical protein [Cyanothece sp. SIO2G6]